MNIVPRDSTPQPLETIASELRDAYAAELGRAPDATTAELLTAQILIETANGESIKNHSPGNISASARWPGDAWRPPWFEAPTDATSPRNRQLHADMLANKAPSAFRSFPTFAAGMRDYVGTLQRQFPTILVARTPLELAQAIFNSGYTRDHQPEEVAPTLAQLVERVRKAGVFDDLAQESPTRPDSPKAGAAPGSSSSASAPRLYRFELPPVLERGSSGPLVVLWQRIVGAGDDGLFGDKTRDATRAWQAQRGLPVTGRVALSCWIVATTGGRTPHGWNA